MIELTKCPECGKSPRLSEVEGQYKYMCGVHRACGEWYSTKEKAAEDWNLRASFESEFDDERYWGKPKMSICSDKQIVENYIGLVDGILGNLNEYRDEDAPPIYHVQSYFSIIQHLLLQGTTHSGGTSTIEKCKELGFDYSEEVIFGEVEEVANDGG